jgi:hypothetical protein
MIAYENIRTRTLASDSIEKSENDATKANDESFPYTVGLELVTLVGILQQPRVIESRKRVQRF